LQCPTGTGLALELQLIIAHSFAIFGRQPLCVYLGAAWSPLLWVKKQHNRLLALERAQGDSIAITALEHTLQLQGAGGDLAIKNPLHSEWQSMQ